MPSVNSSSLPNVFDSSMVTTPSLPTLSMASASTLPMAGSAAEIEATWAISDLSSISLAWPWMSATAAATAAPPPPLGLGGVGVARVGQLVDAGRERAAGVVVELQDLGHRAYFFFLSATTTARTSRALR